MRAYGRRSAALFLFSPSLSSVELVGIGSPLLSSFALRPFALPLVRRACGPVRHLRRKEKVGPLLDERTEECNGATLLGGGGSRVQEQLRGEIRPHPLRPERVSLQCCSLAHFLRQMCSVMFTFLD